jgi:SAM-dependent methyltransferase
MTDSSRRILDPETTFPAIETGLLTKKAAIGFARGRVLDIGCGAGRHSLYLQEKGHQVLGVDVSPMAIRTSKLRGLKNARLMSIAEIGPELGHFDTILMLGNNFGLFGNPSKARSLLRKFLKMTTVEARIITESLDIYKPPVPAYHRKYQAMNKKRGRMPGQVRMRVRYREFATPWFDYLPASKNEMKRIVKGTGWAVQRFIESKGPRYVAIIRRERVS